LNAFKTLWFECRSLTGGCDAERTLRPPVFGCVPSDDVRNCGGW